MKFEVYDKRLETNERGLKRALKSWQRVLPQSFSTSMIDLLTTELCLDDVFAENLQHTLKSCAMRAALWRTSLVSVVT